MIGHDHSKPKYAESIALFKSEQNIASNVLFHI
jgi:hypothetical protein